MTFSLRLVQYLKNKKSLLSLSSWALPALRRYVTGPEVACLSFEGFQSQYLDRFGFELHVVRILHQDRAADQLIVFPQSWLGAKICGTPCWIPPTVISYSPNCLKVQKTPQNVVVCKQYDAVVTVIIMSAFEDCLSAENPYTDSF
jgi:hypothetical protein